MTVKYTSTNTDQVKLNLEHYNLWTRVQVYNDHILSGLPPAKLTSSDLPNKKEWIVCKNLRNTKLSIHDVNNWFEEIKGIIKNDENNVNDEVDGITDKIRNEQLDDNENNETNNETNEDKMKDTNEKTNEKTNNDDNNDDTITKWDNLKYINGKGRPNRITIALINDDGTIVYYFIYDGITKPRQN
ncbi:SEN15 [Candida pseudojiufengensis]|uniref:SEN15 n=1 Tax=Candida pseudojiufengensis TaxID=497109 RepID=UPI0022243849|nr:SEN15 [Candida pseudojiufengensis]KAI5966436.1 SEN15 [Candida pseudojiufengensis]